MHKHLKKVLCVGLFFVVFVGGLFFPASTFATSSDEVVETNYFGNFADDSEGCGIYMILNIVIDILSMGVAIAGVIGVTIAGTQYMSAKDNEEKTKKAKSRIFEIVIGLVAYAVLFVGVQWLLPGGMINKGCKTISDEELAQIKEQERREKDEAKKADNSSSSSSSSSSDSAYKESKAYKNCIKKAAKVVKEAGICEYDSAAKRIIETAKLLAYKKGTSKETYSYLKGEPKKEYKSARNEVLKGKADWDPRTTAGASCLVFTSTVVRGSGVDSKYSYGNGQYTYTSKKFKRITCKKCKPYSKSKPGDIVMYYNTKWGGAGHAFVRGDGVIYEAQYGTTDINKSTYPHTASSKNRIDKVNEKKAYVVILRPKD